ncbi:hypothetical protein CW354_13095 [Marinicaulis flavus]|uniref:Uncharacterized protein n=1 Tax=Hyphococcus luteus TaxID=2058213 RepID=A0A2S7K4D6_9PROT|nr:hypothetical protein CW354_13095 [Marinicaulis flavus]
MRGETNVRHGAQFKPELKISTQQLFRLVLIPTVARVRAIADIGRGLHRSCAQVEAIVSGTAAKGRRRFIRSLRFSDIFVIFANDSSVVLALNSTILRIDRRLMPVMVDAGWPGHVGYGLIRSLL